MPRISHAFAVISLVILSGCSTTQDVVLAKATPTKKVSTVARAPEPDNAADMNDHLDAALKTQGFVVKQPVAPGMRKSADADAIVTYADTWRWDLVMYLKDLTVRLYDAETGDLLVMGQWHDFAMHGFRDAKVVMQNLVGEMVAKLQTAAK